MVWSIWKHLQQAIGKEKVLGGFASIIATLNEQGHVEHTGASSANQLVVEAMHTWGKTIVNNG